MKRYMKTPNHPEVTVCLPLQALQVPHMRTQARSLPASEGFLRTCSSTYNFFSVGAYTVCIIFLTTVDINHIDLKPKSRQMRWKK